MIPRPIRQKRRREAIATWAAAAAFLAILCAGFSMPLWITHTPLLVKPVAFADRN